MGAARPARHQLPGPRSEGRRSSLQKPASLATGDCLYNADGKALGWAADAPHIGLDARPQAVGFGSRRRRRQSDDDDGGGGSVVCASTPHPPPRAAALASRRQSLPAVRTRSRGLPLAAGWLSVRRRRPGPLGWLSAEHVLQVRGGGGASRAPSSALGWLKFSFAAVYSYRCGSASPDGAAAVDMCGAADMRGAPGRRAAASAPAAASHRRGPCERRERAVLGK
jgi:hypothetical protein